MVDIYTQFNEALAELRKSPAKEAKFRSLVPLGAQTSVEVQLNCAKEVLAGKVTESTPIKKFNGASQNFTEGSPLNEGRSQAITEGNKPRNVFAGGDAVLIERMTHPVTKQPLTEAEKRSLTGGKPAAYTNLNARQQKEYDSARMFNFSESDSMVLAKMTR